MDDATVAVRLLADRRDELGAARTATVNRPHRLLMELISGGTKKDLSAAQAKKLLATVRPRDLVGRTRRRLAAQLIVDLQGIDTRIKTADTELDQMGDRDRQPPAGPVRDRSLQLSAAAG